MAIVGPSSKDIYTSNIKIEMENLEIYMIFKMQFYKYNLLFKVSKTGGILEGNIIKLFKSELH